MSWQVVTAVGLSICAALFLGTRAYLTRQKADAAIKRLTRRLDTVVKSRELLMIYTPDYFNTLNDAGWPEFVVVVDRLLTLRSWIVSEYQRGNYSDARMIAEFLLDTSNPAYREPVLSKHPHIAQWVGWQKSVSASLTPIVLAISEAAQDTRELGISRGHRRESTIVVAKRICDALRSLAEVQNLSSGQ